MYTSSSWQSVLQHILKVSGERQRMATALGLSPMTLTRWANGESNPQRPHLIHLLQVVQPQYREGLLEGLEAVYPDIQSWLKDDTSEQIPSEFFAQLLNIRTTTTDTLRFWRISELISKQLLVQLDSNQLGMSITLVQCMPPSSEHDNKICSLRERVGKGTYPWAADLEHLALFLGMESLGGYAVESRHIVNVDDLRKDKLLPAYQSEHEVSAAAHPIMLGGRVAGCLSASSTQFAYFTQSRQALLAAFSDLASLAFEKDDFYPPSMIELKVMPKPRYQRPVLSTFRQRVSNTLTAASHQHTRINNLEAEQKVWQELEKELLNLPDEAYEE
jgi:transcriptional regulator with XRE-family HTH domain